MGKDGLDLRVPDYAYDVFLSYRRAIPHARRWSTGVLYPELREWLALELGVPNERVFLDVDKVDTGEPWPTRIREALLQSKCMVAVLCPQYRESSWCMTEWNTMLDRHRRTGHRCLYPLQVFDGEFYPSEAHLLSPALFDQFATLTPGDKRKKFRDRCKQLARDLGPILQSAPPQDPSWSVIPANDAIGTMIKQPEFP